MTPELSVVLPMHDEAPNVSAMIEAVRSELIGLDRSFEVICVDDGSTDDTGARLVAESRRDPQVQIVQLSRNFGKEAALAAGLEAAQGRAVILLDADLQHPAELIPAMVAQWDAGFDVVEAVKKGASTRARERLQYRMARVLFYSMMGRTAGERLQESSDFKLLDRQVVDALAEFPERNRFFRGLVTWIGFRVAQVPFEVRPRAAGTTKWPTTHLVRYALRNLVAFSSAPLRLVAWTGFAILALDAVLGLQTFWNWWRGAAVTGFTTVILLVVGLGGLILLSLGVIAIYLAQMYDEQKARPIYVVRANRPHDVGRQ